MSLAMSDSSVASVPTALVCLVSSVWGKKRALKSASKQPEYSFIIPVTAIQAPCEPASTTRPKRILVLSYSQTGQLAAVVESLLNPLRTDPRFSVRVETLMPLPAFPFPWSLLRFLDAFPESTHLRPPPLELLTLTDADEFDLIILPYQVWFLSPSQPVTAFLKHPLAGPLLRGKPVITVIACRNMWLLAQEKTKGLLSALGAHLIDNVVVVDRAPTMATLLTTPLWLLTGNRKFIPGLPPAGIDKLEIARAVRFGRALVDALCEGRETMGQPLLRGLQAVDADPNLLFSERAATRSFLLWGKILMTAGAPGSQQRKPLLLLYLVFLIVLVFTVVPVSLAVQKLLRPFLRHRMSKLKQHFELPSGSGDERLPEYDY